jgi:alpha-tubulin suppressor-like RCC1 family protein
MSYWNDRNFGMIAAFHDNTAAVKTDGTAVAVGLAINGQTDLSGFSEVVQIASGEGFTAALDATGHILTAGTAAPQAYISGAGDIAKLSAGTSTLVILNRDGSVGYRTKFNDFPEIIGWEGIVDVAAGNRYALGVKDDGGVLVSNNKSATYPELTSWTDIIQIATHSSHVVGLKSDGTVIGTGTGTSGELNVGAWTNIIQVDCGTTGTVGLKSDGGVVYTGYEAYGIQAEIANWTEVVQIAAGRYHVNALRADGTVLHAGNAANGLSDAELWTNVSLGQHYDINGITSIDGIPVSMEVRAHEAIAGGLLFKTQSDANGEYTLRLPRWYEAYVMAIPPAGHRPMCHGPITKPDDIQV